MTADCGKCPVRAVLIGLLKRLKALHEDEYDYDVSIGGEMEKLLKRLEKS